VAAATESASADRVVGEAVCKAGSGAAMNAWARRAQITFSGPPYDLDAWTAVRGDVDAKIDAADAACGCATETCVRNRTWLTDLRRQVSDFETSIRSGNRPAAGVASPAAVTTFEPLGDTAAAPASQSTTDHSPPKTLLGPPATSAPQPPPNR